MRKVLSFVLVLSLVLGSFSMAFAATPASGLSDIADSANADAIQVAYDLGIVTGNPDGTFLPEKAVNRAEFAAMITRALAVPESALAGYTATKFKDTVGYGWAVPYLAFCESKGIMLGDGNGNAMPGRTINTNEAMTMALRAIGYTANSAELVGAWPANYVTLAQNKGLYDDVAAVVSVDKANAAQVIYNALTVQKVSVNADGETKLLTTGTPAVNATLLNTGLGATAWTTATLIVGNEDAAINLTPFIGAAVIAYEKDDEIIAIGEVKSTFLTVDKVTTADTKFKTENGTEYTLPASVVTNYAIYLNAEQTTSSTDTAIVLAKGQKFAVELTGKTVKTLYSLATWDVDNAEVADASTLEALDDKELLGSKFKKDDDKNIDLNSFELLGVSSLDKIAKDNVVYVYEKGGNGTIVKVSVGTEIVKGKVTEVDGSNYYINGVKYKAAAANGFQKATNPTVGDTVTAYLDFSGNVFDWDADSRDADNYAVATFYQVPAIDDAKIKLYTSDDKTKTYTINDDATVTTNVAITIGASRALVGYALDKDGAIETLDYIPTGSAVGTVTLESINVLNLGGKTYQIDKNVAVFTDDGTDLGVSAISKIKTDKNLNGAGTFQMILDGQKVVAMVVDKAAAGKSDSDSYAVFNKLTTTVDSDDKAIQRLQGYADGVAFDKVTAKSTTFDGAALVKNAPTLYKVELQADGVVGTITTKAAVDPSGATIAAINSDRTAVQTGTTASGVWYSLGDDVVVYEITDYATSADFAYKISSVNSLRAANNYVMWVYETDSDSSGVEVVIFTRM